MSTELFGLVYLVIGVALLVWGAKLAQLVLALWGLGIGLWIGQLVTSGQSFAYSWVFVTVWGIGLIMMLLAYTFYKVALSLIIGFTLFWFLGGSLAHSGLGESLIFFLSAAGGLVAGLFALRSELSYVVLMLISAVIGAGYTLCGALILLDGSNVGAIGYGPLSLVLAQSTTWVLALVALILVSLILQAKPQQTAAHGA
jgi:hypothetical protein